MQTVRYGDRHLGELVAARIEAEHYSLAHALLAALPVREAVTTNYDTLFEGIDAGDRLLKIQHTFVLFEDDELLLFSVSLVVVVPAMMLTLRKSNAVLLVSCVTMFVQKVSDAAVAFDGMETVCVSVSVSLLLPPSVA